MAAIREKGVPACVGIDPVYERLPADIAEQREMNDATDVESALDAVREFCVQIIRIVAPLVPAVKINSAFFERYYWEGVEVYFDVIQEAAAAGLVVIGDVKRGDIGHTSGFYARAHLSRPDFVNVEELQTPDAVTVNPYFGIDGLKCFLDVARQQDKGVFALVQTSNESAGEIQGLTLEGGMKLSERVGVLVNEWAGDDGLMGAEGYSSLGAVVSPYIEKYTSEWEKCVQHACRDFVRALQEVVPQPQAPAGQLPS